MSFVTMANTSRWQWPILSRSAEAAAYGVVVTYAKEKPNVEVKLTADDDPDQIMTSSYGTPRSACKSERGDAAGAFASAAVKLDQTTT